MKTLLTVFLVFLLAGCTESFTGSEGTNQGAVPSKLRNSEIAAVSEAGKGGGKPEGSSDPSITQSASDAYVIGIADGIDAMAIIERYSLDYGVSPRRVFKKAVNGFSVRVDRMTDAQKAAWLADMDAGSEVTWYEPEPKMNMTSGGARTMSDGRQWTPKRLKEVGGTKSSAASGDGQGSVDVDVYVIDSGVNHPDLNVVERIDFASLDADLTASRIMERYAVLERYALLERYEYEMQAASDLVGHGTHVAGTIGAIDDSAYLVGVAPGVRIHDFRVLNAMGHGEFGAVIEAMEVIITRKQQHPETPMVVNLSLGANVGSTSYNGLDYTVAKAVAAGITVVAAAGNEAIDVSLVSPAHVSGVLAVGSVYLAKNGWHISNSSNVGRGIDIWGPGESVESLDPFDLLLLNELTGTSMAAPHVTGAVALILANDPGASPHSVEITLKQDSNYKVHRAPAGLSDLVVDLGRL